MSSFTGNTFLYGFVRKLLFEKDSEIIFQLLWSNPRALSTRIGERLMQFSQRNKVRSFNLKRSQTEDQSISTMYNNKTYTSVKI